MTLKCLRLSALSGRVENCKCKQHHYKTSFQYLWAFGESAFNDIQPKLWGKNSAATPWDNFLSFLGGPKTTKSPTARWGNFDCFIVRQISNWTSALKRYKIAMPEKKLFHRPFLCLIDFWLTSKLLGPEFLTKCSFFGTKRPSMSVQTSCGRF